jgi:hypothetical protein
MTSSQSLMGREVRFGVAATIMVRFDARGSTEVIHAGARGVTL